MGTQGGTKLGDREPHHRHRSDWRPRAQILGRPQKNIRPESAGTGEHRQSPRITDAQSGKREGRHRVQRGVYGRRSGLACQGEPVLKCRRRVADRALPHRHWHRAVARYGQDCGVVHQVDRPDMAAKTDSKLHGWREARLRAAERSRGTPSNDDCRCLAVVPRSRERG